MYIYTHIYIYMAACFVGFRLILYIMCYYSYVYVSLLLCMFFSGYSVSLLYYVLCVNV